MGVSTRAQGGNNIFCVCGAIVDLYIQLSCASKRRRASGDQSPWSGGQDSERPVAFIPAIESKLGATSPHFRVHTPLFGVLVKGVDCPVKNGGFVKGVDFLVKYRGSSNLSNLHSVCYHNLCLWYLLHSGCLNIFFLVWC